ncbi:unnamed protein product [Cyclocybe aegerita]|uniref:RRM domain-containing protein n=1 Tax=Cyclocybe aegerita TaxID=1973307 RepID=A0A8S0XU58_CYCAE|nr:unnamed protein product [Cyclocybe aegerita]
MLQSCVHRPRRLVKMPKSELIKLNPLILPLTTMSKRLYLGRLPPDTRSEDVSKFFEGYGRIMDCRVMTGFGFVEFETAKDAEDAVHTFNGKPFMGANIVIEFAKESRPRREYQEDRSYSGPRSRRPPGIRLIVSGVSRDTSWQDLKDFGRDAGSVSFADVDRDIPGQGVLEYLSREDADRAVKELDGKDLRGRPVRVTYDDSVWCLFSLVVKANWPSRSALVLITTAAMTVAVNGATIDTRMIATATIDTAANALGRLPAVVNLTIVDPGLPPQGGNMTIKGLQGTMIIGEAAMMTTDPLIIIMTAVGMTKNAEGTTDDATTRKTDMRIGLPETEKHGLVEELPEARLQVKKGSGRRAMSSFEFGFLTDTLSDLCGVIVVYPDRVLL